MSNRHYLQNIKEMTFIRRYMLFAVQTDLFVCNDTIRWNQRPKSNPPATQPTVRTQISNFIMKFPGTFQLKTLKILTTSGRLLGSNLRHTVDTGHCQRVSLLPLHRFSPDMCVPSPPRCVCLYLYSSRYSPSSRARKDRRNKCLSQC